MNTAGYEIGLTIPVQVGKGKMEKGKNHTEATVEDAKTRNEKYNFVGIKALKDTEKDLAHKAKVKSEMAKRNATNRDNGEMTI